MFLCMFQVPGGPAYLQLEPGDVLVRVNGEVSYTFSQTYFLFCFFFFLNENCGIIAILYSG